MQAHITASSKPVIKDAKLFLQICDLTNKSMITGDFDPVYPMLEVLCHGMDKEDSLWYAFCYVGHYNLASGAWSFHNHPKQVEKFPVKYPIRFQRRNLHPTGEYDAHFQSMWNLKQKYGSLAAWLEEGMTGEGEHDFNYIRERVLMVHGNGRWAGMKLGEVLKYSTYPHLKPCDMGHKYSAAPRKGLGYFYTDPGGNTPAVIKYLDACGRHLTDKVKFHLAARDSPIVKSDYKWPFDVAEMETNLCDFKSMCAGEFYSGKCADVVLKTMTEAETEGYKDKAGLTVKCPTSVLSPLYNARAELFEHNILGEFGNGEETWDGVDPKRDEWFSKYGVIPWRHESTKRVTEALRSGTYQSM